ncbi:MAG: glycosyltransferase [Burkholderiales bacterium]|nr:glycosyltransferase [Burkholderiales bacterium]
MERHVSLLLGQLKNSVAVDNIVSNDVAKTVVAEADGYRIYKTRSYGLLASVPISPLLPVLARKLWRQNRYDIAHLHFPDPLAHLATYFLPRSAKIVISWHSDVVRQKNLLALYQPFLDHLVRRADAVIAATPAHFTSSTQLRSAPRDRLHVVPYGIDYSAFDKSPEVEAAAMKIRAAYPGKKIIFSVGRHVYYKGFEYLIRAMTSVPNAVLLLGGSGPLDEELSALGSALNLGDRVFFIGRIPDEDLPAYYHASDVYCMPSVEKSEAFGLVQLEAMACAKPVVGCELNNGASYVNRHGETGLLVPPRDSAGLARALNELLGDESLRIRLGNNGRIRATRKFSLERMTNGTLAVYRKVIARA